MENLQDYKTELPKLEWPLDDSFQWFAVDGDGAGYFYEQKPEIFFDYWSEGGEFSSVGYFPSLAADWQNSLTKRPDNV